MKQNPKLEGTPVYDCIPQTGACPINCNQCYFNRPNAYYYPISKLPLIPKKKVVGNGIVRMNCGHDSNISRYIVLEAARRYKHVFFNTSIPQLDFPGPVVFTANPKEEEESACLFVTPPKNLMFVRLRTSGTNLYLIDRAVEYYTAFEIPIVITMMAYYTNSPPTVMFDVKLPIQDCYVWQKRHINSYWCPTPVFKRAVMERYKNNRNVSLCEVWCRDCRNCESYYWQTLKRMNRI